ncbi:putative acetyltransferase [Ulvibacter sp. MAR_2010_11]|uniref:GNAT family N-acetyltransferase n=1 Tax=Ulvibacter sp. MAR_2010_11 TaxID=1250229 RepID=UPI000C2CAF9A|nr:GNAT family N-acetyltransferase [Ulvibacter sp. MAR_2010_11]PKA81903.1 putative acetyltransferase [Ulvibacter sp. MAR_2010_11]
MSSPIIRPIEKKDNVQIAKIIRSVLEDFGVPKIGSAYADVSLNAMYENYDVPGAAYFVLEENGRLIGGGGVAQLANYDGKVCELQKMYFLPEARGRGMGTKMIDTCLQAAQDLGYEHCYLETMSYMEAAQKLYKKYGFEYLEGAMGDTGHYACGVHMIKTL